MKINKCRGLNSLRNAQNNKGQKEGPGNEDTDGMFWGFHPYLKDYVDTEKMKEQIEAGIICPVTSIDANEAGEVMRIAETYQ